MSSQAHTYSRGHWCSVCGCGCREVDAVSYETTCTYPDCACPDEDVPCEPGPRALVAEDPKSAHPPICTPVEPRRKFIMGPCKHYER